MNQNDNDGNGTRPESGKDYARQAHRAADQARAAAEDALGVARRLMTNPVAGVGDAHSNLGSDRVLGVGVVFAVIAALALALAGGQLVRTLVMAAVGSFGMPGAGFRFGAFLRAILTNLGGIAGAAAGVLLLAPVFGGRTNPGSALFTAANAALPLGLLALAASIVNAILQNRLGMILSTLLVLYGACYLVMVLNAGLQQIVGIDERRAALATPSVLAVMMTVMWLLGWLLG